MELDVNGIRARLDQVSLDDLDAIHDLYLAAQKLARNSTGVSPKMEVYRWAERRMGQALRRGQQTGEVRSQGQAGTKVRGRSPLEFIPGAHALTDAYQMADGISDAEFALLLEQAKARGSLTRASVIALLPAREERVTRRPTVKGRRTLEHMAVQIDALAMGVQNVDPAEVDADALADVIEKVFEDIGTIRSFLRRVKKA